MRGHYISAIVSGQNIPTPIEPVILSFLDVGADIFTIPTGLTKCSILVVAGGGGAGPSGNSGGGGAGGLIYENEYVFSSDELIAGEIALFVGAGGEVDNNGGNSVFGILTAIGGGKGGSGVSPFSDGSLGGSGGGGGYAKLGGLGTINQGFAGGRSYSSNYWGAGGGGGGAGEVGHDVVDLNNGGYPGKGGDGLYYGDIFGFGFGDYGWFSGGGSGGSWDNLDFIIPIGGKGGGGGESTGRAGSPNTGGGGSGCFAQQTPFGGGSGIILIKY